MNKKYSGGGQSEKNIFLVRTLMVMTEVNAS